MLEKRRFGRHQDTLSIIGFGAIVVMDETAADAAERVAWAIDQGVNYFDCAPSYGNAEEMLGPALKPYREEVFLAEKSTRRDAGGVREEMENSLRVLQTDRFDLYQLHALTTEDDVEQCFAPGGAMEEVLKAREAGKIRYIGFSAHSEAAALDALDRFDFDSILFPINYACWNETNFGPAVVEAAKAKGVARLALKGMAKGKLDGVEKRWQKPWYDPHDVQSHADLALRWTLSQDITAAIPPGEWPLFKMAVEIASENTPLDARERERLMALEPEAVPLFP